MPIEGLAHFYFNVFHILLHKGRCWQCKLRSPVYVATSVFRQPDERCGWLMLLLLRFDVRAGCSIRNIQARSYATTAASVVTYFRAYAVHLAPYAHDHEVSICHM